MERRTLTGASPSGRGSPDARAGAQPNAGSKQKGAYSPQPPLISFKAVPADVSRVDQDRLADALGRFEGSPDARRVVARQARDLADAGLYEADFGDSLTVETVVSNLRDAPDEHTLVERWNWWVGSLEVSHGGYDRFRVRRL